MKFLRSTLRDSANTVSLVDLTTVENAGVIRGLESGPGIKLRVVDADESKHITKQKKIIISLDGAGPGGGGEINTGVNLGGGENIFKNKTGSTLNFRTLTAGGAVELSTVGDTILISARNITTLGQLTNDVGFITEASAISLLTSAGATQVEQTPLGGGEFIIVAISGLGDIQQKTIIGAGGIDVTSTTTEITISAAPNPTLLSQLNNDVGFITETSANAAYLGVGTLTLLSQFTNDQGFVSAAQFTGGGIVSVQVSGTGAGQEIRVSANGTIVTETAFGSGQSSIIGITGGSEIQHKTFVGGGGVEVSGGTTTITISAAPNPTLLSELANDVGFITEGSAQTLINNINQVSAVSQLLNDAGYITEASANAAYVGVGTLTSLSQFTNDPGFITEASALSLLASAGATQVKETTLGGGEAIIVSISGLGDIQHRTIVVGGGIELSANPTELVLSAAPNPTLVSELTNDLSFVNQVSALGGGENVYIGTSATELQFKTITGGGIVNVTTSGNTIKVSATGGGGISIEEDGSPEGSPSTLNFIATGSNHNLGKAIEIDGSATTTAVVNLYIPLQFSVRLNWTGAALSVGNEVSELPPGWTYDVLSTTQIRINHNVGRFVRNFFWRGFQTTGTYYQFTAPTTGGTLRTIVGSETTSFVLHVTSTNGAGTVTSGHAYAEVSF